MANYTADYGRYQFIDSIRGIAALGVVYLHVSTLTLASAWAFEKPILFLLREPLDTGKFGVALFFMVSGFVVPFSMRGERVPGLAKFCVSRFFRLYPLYWLSILAALSVTFILHNHEPSIRTVLANFTMFQQFVGIPNLENLYWTLQIELIFYALCAVLFVAGYLNRATILALSSAICITIALAAGTARFYLDNKIPVAVPIALCLMFIGALWRKHLLEGNVESGKYAKYLIGSFLALIPVISVLAYNRDTGYHETWYRYTISYWAAVIAFCGLSTIWKVRSRIPVFLGRISYSIYLMQGPLLQLYTRFAYPHLRPLPVHVHVIIISLIDIGISYATFTLVEQPAIAQGKKVASYLVARLRPVPEMAAAGELI